MCGEAAVSERADVLVVGGGIAGIAASVALADAGVRVELIETRKKLGGRATSFRDARTGDEVDNCQHVALGCCANFRWLCDRLGVGGLIEWWERLWWYEDGGRVSEVGSVRWLPAPGHLLPGLARASFLDGGEKAALAVGMAHAMRADRSRWRGVSFGAWLSEVEQPSSVVERFWSPLIVSACNAGVDRVAASVGLHVVQEGLLSTREAFEIGVPRVPLSRLYEPAVRVIERSGGRVRLGVGASAVSAREVRLRGGGSVAAGGVVLAAPFERAIGLLTAGGASDERVRMMGELEHSPIVGVHLAFDRAVLGTGHGVLLGDSTPWVFRKDTEGRRVHAVISAADGWVDLDEAAVVRRVVGVMRRCLGGMDGARIEHARVVKEKRATFVPGVEAERSRVAAQGSSGVVLAGCYTATGWPSTMEGATRSGLRAAEVVLGERSGAFVRGGLKPAVVPRLFGGRTLRRQGLGGP